MTTFDWIFIGLVAAFSLAAALMDLRFRRIPNWFTVPTFAAGLIYHVASGGLSGLGTAFAGFAVGFGILFVLWLIGGGGGGDVKLMGALGAWLGATYTLFVILLSGLLAAFFSVVVLMFAVSQTSFATVRKKHFNKVGQRADGGKRPLSEEALAKQKAHRRLMPYALPVACSTWAILIWHYLKNSV